MSLIKYLSMICLCLSMLMGCRNEESECSGEAACGFGEVCVEGRCVGQSCATSAQCDIESFCQDGKCLSGCQNDQDCLPGDSCNLETQVRTAAAQTHKSTVIFSSFAMPSVANALMLQGYIAGNVRSMPTMVAMAHACTGVCNEIFVVCPVRSRQTAPVVIPAPIGWTQRPTR